MQLFDMIYILRKHWTSIYVSELTCLCFNLHYSENVVIALDTFSLFHVFGKTLVSCNSRKNEKHGQNISKSFTISLYCCRSVKKACSVLCHLCRSLMGSPLKSSLFLIHTCGEKQQQHHQQTEFSFIVENKTAGFYIFQINPIFLECTIRNTPQELQLNSVLMVPVLKVCRKNCPCKD